MKNESFARTGWFGSRRDDWIALSPLLLAYIILLVLWTNLPILDDFDHLFLFAVQYRIAPTGSEKLHVLLTSQVGPYKLLLPHSLEAAELYLTGQLHLGFLVLLGNLSPLGILWLLWRSVPKDVLPREKSSLLVFLPLTALVFNLNYAEALNWSLGSLQQPTAIFFALASLYLLVKRPARWGSLWGACCLACAATASNANGLFLWPIGGLYLLLERQGVKKLLLWSMGCLLCILFYFYGYVSEASSSSPAFFKKLLFFLMFCGGAPENMHHRPVPYISAVLGLGVVLTFLHALKTGFARRNPFLMYTAGWLLLNAAVVANSRIVMGLQLSLSSRYKIFSDLLFAFCLLYLVDRVSGRVGANGTRASRTSSRPLVVATAAILLLLMGGDLAGANLLKRRRTATRAAIALYEKDPSRNFPTPLPEGAMTASDWASHEQTRTVLNQAIALGIYRLP